jgi:hypothetical protein
MRAAISLRQKNAYKLAIIGLKPWAEACSHLRHKSSRMPLSKCPNCRGPKGLGVSTLGTATQSLARAVCFRLLLAGMPRAAYGR